MSSNTSPLPKPWNLPDSIRNRLGRDAGPQRAMFEEGHLLIILHELPKPDERERKPALFWRNPQGEWRSNAMSGSGLPTLANHLRAYDLKLTELDAAEVQAATAAEYHQVLEVLAPVLRASRGLHRALQQARELVPDEHELINLRDQSASIERTAELLLQDAQFGLNFVQARQAEAQAAAARQMAKTAHRLNLLAALFLPLTALASIFGMDIHSRLADTPENFWMICAAGITTGLIVMAMLSKRG
jgi:hypothetical protein